MGSAVGRIMAGADETYTHTSLFNCEVFEFGYETVSELDTSLEAIEDWIEPNVRGAVFYLREGRVRGVLLCETRSMTPARSLPRTVLTPPWTCAAE